METPAFFTTKVPLTDPSDEQLGLILECSKESHCNPALPAILFCHGLSSNRSIWLDVSVKLINSGYSVAFYDMIGHGDSACSQLRAKRYILDRFGLNGNCSDLLEIIKCLRSTLQRTTAATDDHPLL